MNTNEPMPQERLDEIRERLDWVEYPTHEELETLGNKVIWVERSPIDGEICSGAEVANTAGPGIARFYAHAPQDLEDLLAEVERLWARLTVDDGMVERAARAFYEYPTPGVDVSLTPGWDRLTATSPDIATAYRNRIRAALEAAHNPGMWS